MQIAIASGKGGTGKTTVSVNLYYFLSEKYNNQVQLIDCDVEEPNDILFFSQAKKKQKKRYLPSFLKLIKKNVPTAKNVLNGANSMQLASLRNWNLQK